MTAIDCAKIFVAHGMDDCPKTFDGSMKIQKLLYFANLISLIERDELLFDDPISAFKYGCVVDSVRVTYRDNYAELHDIPEEVSEDVLRVLEKTERIFGDCGAAELSELNHQFSTWQRAYERSVLPDGYIKDAAILSEDELRSELDAMADVLRCFDINENTSMKREKINDVVFYFDPDFDITEEVISHLYDFSLVCEDEAYTVYYDGEELIVY